MPNDANSNELPGSSVDFARAHADLVRAHLALVSMHNELLRGSEGKMPRLTKSVFGETLAEIEGEENFEQLASQGAAREPGAEGDSVATVPRTNFIFAGVIFLILAFAGIAIVGSRGARSEEALASQITKIKQDYEEQILRLNEQLKVNQDTAKANLNALKSTQAELLSTQESLRKTEARLQREQNQAKILAAVGNVTVAEPLPAAAAAVPHKKTQLERDREALDAVRRTLLQNLQVLGSNFDSFEGTAKALGRVRLQKFAFLKSKGAIDPKMEQSLKTSDWRAVLDPDTRVTLDAQAAAKIGDRISTERSNTDKVPEDAVELESAVEDAQNLLLDTEQAVLDKQRQIRELQGKLTAEQAELQRILSEG